MSILMLLYCYYSLISTEEAGMKVSLWMCVWEDVGMQVFLLQNKSKAFYHGLETATPADGQRKK